MCGIKDAFNEAYEYLRATSELLVRTEKGKIEVYETNGCLLTVVDFEKREFWTKRRQDDPIKYDLGKAELLMTQQKL